jgi:hypothetical protein
MALHVRHADRCKAACIKQNAAHEELVREKLSQFARGYHEPISINNDFSTFTFGRRARRGGIAPRIGV